jgi:hypothetical protein
MNFKSTLQGAMMKLPTGVTRKIGAASLASKRHSPAVLFGVGIVGFGATVVLAARATLKLDEKVDESRKKIEVLEADETLSKKAKKRELATIRGTMAVDTIKLYGPAVVVGLASVTALTGSHVQLVKRNMGLAAAYATLEQGLSEYRRRVAEEFGEDKEREIRYGVTTKEIVEEVDGESKVVTVKRHSGKPGMYSRMFDEYNKHWKREPDYNHMFLSSTQSWANNQLNAYGFLFLNDVYKMLGYEPTRAGQMMGWTKDGPGDDFIDFGVFRNDKVMGQLFVNGEEPSVVLDFNVTNILDQIED